MSKKKQKVEKSAADIAIELLEIRHEAAELKRIDKALSDELRLRINQGETQSYYKLRKDYVLGIKDSTLAFKWASEHNCVKVDTPAVDALLKRDRLSIPDGFGLKELEKLVEIKEKETAEEEGFIT